MAAESLAAIGIASSILQFVDFGSKLLATANEIRHNAAGSVREYQEIDTVTSNLQKHLEALTSSLDLSRDLPLNDLLKQCIPLASEIQSLIRQAQSGGQSMALANNMAKAWKVLRSKKKIVELERRLDRLREGIILHLDILISQRQVTISRKLESFASDARSWQAEIRRRQKQMLEQINIVKPEKDKTSYLEKDKTYLEKKFLTLFTTQVPVEKFDNFVRFFEVWTESLKRDQLTRDVIESLIFAEIKERHSEIKEAHKATFEWIFDRNRSNFGDWLSLSSDLYWISGKAGSGKSTLMKFILGHPKTIDGLQNWAQSAKLVIASHFFWSTGTKLQKSQEGLFRTLLSQILLQCPEITPVVCENQARSESITGWTVSELIGCFTKLATMELPGIRICFFVDGLDEYSGEHKDLVQILRVVGNSPNIKICASSRPWIEFRTAYGNIPWQISVHNLTENDIWAYIVDNFNANEHFIDYMSTRYPRQTTEIMEGIASRAEGVFLWVYLVVRSLIRGLDNHDTIEDLQQRLNHLPVDLESYFEHMMNTIEGFYRQRTARVFKLLLQAETTLPLITFHFSALEDSRPDYALEVFDPSMTASLSQVEHDKSHQLIAQCRDLINITPVSRMKAPFGMKVGFLHRTVTDYFRTQKPEQRLTAEAGRGFDPRLSLCRAFLAQLKISAGQPETFRRQLVVLIIRQAQQIEIHGQTPEQILDALNDMVQASFSRGWNELLQHSIVPYPARNTIVATAARCGLAKYVQLKVAQEQPVRVDALSGILEQPVSAESESGFELLPYERLNFALLQGLLEGGASPNALLPGTGISIWGGFILSLATTHQSSGDQVRQEVAFKICELMIVHGAAETMNLSLQHLPDWSSFYDKKRKVFYIRLYLKRNWAEYGSLDGLWDAAKLKVAGPDGNSTASNTMHHARKGVTMVSSLWSYIIAR